MTTPLTRECAVDCQRRGRGGRRHLQPGFEHQPLPGKPGRVPRLARLMALALRFEELFRSGVITDYRHLAALGQVSPARISQIMNLLQLAPRLQEQLLFLPRTQRGRDPIHLGQVQPIAVVLDWKQQQIMAVKLWRGLNKKPVRENIASVLTRPHFDQA
jgi:hypothetical protein